MRVAPDTNVLACAEGIGDVRRCPAARDLSLRLLQAGVVLPVQVLGELFRVLAGSCRMPPGQVKQIVDHWADTHTTRDSTFDALRMALERCADHGLSTWESLVLAVAAAAAVRCR